MCSCDRPWENMKFKKKSGQLLHPFSLQKSFCFWLWHHVGQRCNLHVLCVSNFWPIVWFIIVVWRSSPNWIKFGMDTKWGMLSPNMVIKLVSGIYLINYSWNLSNLLRSRPNYVCVFVVCRYQKLHIFTSRESISHTKSYCPKIFYREESLYPI